MKALNWEILRGIESNGRKYISLAKKPIRVATVIDEQKFLGSDCKMIHNINVFLEDRFHDWDWVCGKFTYYSRVAEKADVLVVYEIEN